MAHLTIHVPEDHVDALRRELIGAYRERAQALHRMVEGRLGPGDVLEEVQGAVVELRDLHDAIDQLGWEAGPRSGPVPLTAHPEVLADALRALLTGALAELSAIVARLGHDADGAAAVRLAAGISAFVGLLCDPREASS
jgi:hypothetical protein